MLNNELVVTTKSEEETTQIGQFIGESIVSPIVVAVNGELGAGKTVLVRGAARGLGINDQITSPTFVLLKMYQGRMPLYHFDFYRLNENDEDSVAELGFEEYLPGEGAAFVEWAERISFLLAHEYLEIKIKTSYGNMGEKRNISFKAHGKKAESVLASLKTMIQLSNIIN